MGLLRNIELKLSHRKECFCAFCKTPRVVYVKKGINLFNITASALGAIAVMYALFQDLDPRAILIFVAFMAIAEIFVQIRWRLNIVCPECGFDPALYIKEPDRAAKKVKAHLEKRAEDPKSLLKSPLNLPVVRKKPMDPLHP